MECRAKIGILMTIIGTRSIEHNYNRQRLVMILLIDVTENTPIQQSVILIEQSGI